MKKNLLLSLAAVAIILGVFGSSSINVNAEEKAAEVKIEELAKCNWLDDESIEIVTELCQGADSITYYIPDDTDAIAYIDGKSIDNDLPYIMASKTIGLSENDGITYIEQEDILIALSTTSGSYSASGQKYGVAASNVVNITWSYTDPLLSDLSIKFNSMTAKYTNLSTTSSTVTKMEYSASLQPPYGSYTYLGTNSVSNPSAGVNYTKTLNSASYLIGGDTGYAMITVYYANGDSATYEGSLSKKI